MTLIIRNFPLTVQSRGIGVLLRLESVQGTAGYHRLSLLVLLALQGVAPTVISESTRLEESKRRSNQGSGCRSGNERFGKCLETMFENDPKVSLHHVLSSCLKNISWADGAIQEVSFYMIYMIHECLINSSQSYLNHKN